MFSTNSELAPLGGAFGSGAPGQMSIGTQRQTRRDLEQVQRRVVVAKLIEEGRAYLANDMLEHVGALTALEQHLITIAPLGEPRYREIVDSYTIGAAAGLRRWGQ
jgi:hypothetical protein